MSRSERVGQGRDGDAIGLAVTPPPASLRTDGRARYAADPRSPGPRAWPEPEAARRTPFQRDRDRLIHSIAFRRLAHKTQVLGPEDGATHRTRLTHTLEVAQIARSLARALRLDEDLAEALALAHDFGHGPFGHTGETALDEVLAPWGGFDHNVQSLRIVVDLEQRYLDFDGLNLTWTTLEGLAKRKGPCLHPPALLHHYDARLALQLDRYPGAEAQVAALADDIAYNAHDLEDGLQAGFFTLEDAAAVPIVAELSRGLRCGRPVALQARLPFAIARGLIDLFVTDALAHSQGLLAAADSADADAVRGAGRALIALSPGFVAAEAALKRFLFAHLYRHPRLVATRERAGRLVARLAAALVADPGRLPEPWVARAGTGDPSLQARTVADYIAGLTDRQAEREHARLFDGAADFV